MTPEQLGHALAVEMRKHAKADRAEAATFTQNARDFQQRADDARRTADHFTAMAVGWESTADKLASGAITLGDATTLVELRNHVAGAREAIDPRLPFAQQREHLAAAEARGFDPDDVVNVVDAESPDFGKHGVVVSTWSNNTITVKFGNDSTWSFRASQLMHHETFIAQMDAAEQAAQGPEAPVRTDGTYTDAQLDGTACIDCGCEFAEGDDAHPTVVGPRGQMFVHSDTNPCEARR